MAGDARAAMHELDHDSRHACLELLPDQRIRHAIAVTLELDVLVDVPEVSIELDPRVLTSFNMSTKRLLHYERSRDQ